MEVTTNIASGVEEKRAKKIEVKIHELRSKSIQEVKKLNYGSRNYSDRVSFSGMIKGDTRKNPIRC
jgi:hypothetical protein